MKSYERLQSASDYLELVACVLRDAAAKCSADVVYDQRDFLYIKSRVEGEGLSFLTILLPSFAKDFEKALAQGGTDPTLFATFPRKGSRRRRGGIPKFLQGYLSRIFDLTTGKIHLDENPQSNGGAASALATLVDSVRQICRLFAKVELECTETRTRAALDSFVEVEQSFEQFSLCDEDDRRFRLISRMLWDNMVVECKLDDLRPKHGPGATAERIAGNGKFVWRRWHDRLESFFPLIGYAYPVGVSDPSGSFAPWSDVETQTTYWAEQCQEDVLQDVSIVSRDKEEPVRVCLVPKTLKAPRVIAIEPVCMQYVQQGIRDWLYEAIERFSLTAGHINFRDQTINQRLALAASRSGRLATIDLSDASDRVPAALALSMFDGNPDLRDAIDACRTTSALLPDGRVIPELRKFASMGSALCFPVEAMYFYTIVVLALLDYRGLSYTFSNLSKVKEDVYIYGDDIICPADAAEAICEALRKYNCKVNTGKSFWTGKFRESCGVDAYDGQVVTPVYIRKTCPQSRRQSAKLISWNATSILFLEKGYWLTYQFMLAQCERVVGHNLPYLPEGSPGLKRSLLGYETMWWRKGPHRWNRKHQRLEVRALVPSPVHRNDELEGYAALSKSLSLLEARKSQGDPSRSPKGVLRFSSPFESGGRHHLRREALEICSRIQAVDEQHLVRTALHGAVTLKRRWVPAT